jgi:hypothetical protein
MAGCSYKCILLGVRSIHNTCQYGNSNVHINCYIESQALHTLGFYDGEKAFINLFAHFYNYILHRICVVPQQTSPSIHRHSSFMNRRKALNNFYFFCISPSRLFFVVIVRRYFFSRTGHSWRGRSFFVNFIFKVFYIKYFKGFSWG